MPLTLRRHPRLNDHEPLQRCSLEACRGACCLHGVWADRLEVDAILGVAEHVAQYLPEGQRNPADWFDPGEEDDPFTASGRVVHTRVLENAAHYGGTACVFWRPEDAKCALQVAAQAAGEHPWRYKPFYCILHPLDLDDEGHITLDETAALLDESASCLRPADDATPLGEIFAEELAYLLPPRPPFQGGLGGFAP